MKNTFLNCDNNGIAHRVRVADGICNNIDKYSAILLFSEKRFDN